MQRRIRSTAESRESNIVDENSQFNLSITLSSTHLESQVSQQLLSGADPLQSHAWGPEGIRVERHVMSWYMSRG